MRYGRQGHTEEVNCIAISLSGKLAVSGSEDNTVRVWDLESGDCLAVCEVRPLPPYSAAQD
jgi:WD40 repeat protein